MQVEIRKRRAEWVVRLTQLAEQVSNWSIAEGWQVDRQEVPITEDMLGTYTAPLVTVHLAAGDVLVTPVGLNVAGGQRARRHRGDPNPGTAQTHQSRYGLETVRRSECPPFV